MSTSLPDRERILELLADRAIFGLSIEEDHELRLLLAKVPDIDPEEFEWVAATAQLAHLDELVEMPANVKARIATDGRRMVASDRMVERARDVDSASRRELLAWFCAAASLLAAMFFAARSGEQTVAAIDPAELKDELLRSPDNLTKVSWSAGPDEAGKNARGEVIWDNKGQQGVMSFRGLPANNPTKQQYQLWIFDTAQDEKYPIDGGVFDIPPGDKEVVVPINAKLPVEEPTLFAITIEKPGGVVVSSRERLPLLAQVAK